MDQARQDARDGASASLYHHGSDVLKVFTSSAAPLIADQTYTLWGSTWRWRTAATTAAARHVRALMPPRPRRRPTLRIDQHGGADVTSLPRRVQLRRTKGWRMPPNTVKVSRPSKWGNPFVVGRMYHHTDPLFAYIVATAPELGSARSGWTPRRSS